MEISDPKLRQYLTDIHLTPDEIYKQANPVIEDIVGFNYDDVDYLLDKIPYIMLNISYSSDKRKPVSYKNKRDDFIDFFQEYYKRRPFNKSIRISVNQSLHK